MIYSVYAFQQKTSKENTNSLGSREHPHYNQYDIALLANF
jgi:hypothetical protein